MLQRNFWICNNRSRFIRNSAKPIDDELSLTYCFKNLIFWTTLFGDSSRLIFQSVTFQFLNLSHSRHFQIRPKMTKRSLNKRRKHLLSHISSVILLCSLFSFTPDFPLPTAAFQQTEKKEKNHPKEHSTHKQRKKMFSRFVENSLENFTHLTVEIDAVGNEIYYFISFLQTESGHN